MAQVTVLPPRERIPASQFQMPRGATHRLSFPTTAKFSLLDPAEPGDQAWTIEGYGSVSGVLSPPMVDFFGSYQARVVEGAFADVLAGNCDTRLLLNHDPNYLMGRTTNGTLTLTEDDHGLAYSATPADVSYAKDVRVLLERGDITGSSIGFAVAEDAWIEETDGDGDLTVIWEIRKFAALDDVSPVTFPAFPKTASRVRTSSNPSERFRRSVQRRLALAAADVPRRTR